MGQKKAILYIDHALTTGGSTKVLLNVLEELNRSTVEPIVACAAGSELELILRRKKIRTAPFSMPWFTKRSSPLTWFIYVYRLVGFGFSVAKLARSSKTACIHANGFIAALYALLPSKLANVPLLWHMHDILERGRINRFFVTMAAARADRIICVSGAVEQRLLDFGVSEAKCEVVYNFIREPAGDRSDSPFRFRTEFNIAGTAHLVGMIGNICPMKGQTVFVEAARRIALQRPDTVYIIVGDTNNPLDEDYKKELMRQITASGLGKRVVLTGFRKDAFRILRDFDILVHPATLPESLGLVLLEAMQQGKPVVASAVGGIPEVVVNGVNGILVRPGDPEGLAQAITDLLDRPEMRAQFGNEGKRIVSEKFDRTKIVGQLNDLYNRVLSKADGRPGTYYAPH